MTDFNRSTTTLRARRPGIASTGPARMQTQQPDAQAASRAVTGTGRTLDSTALLQGHSHVNIMHNGEAYQLRATRLGKLILTK